MGQGVTGAFIRLPEINVKKECASEEKVTVHRKIDNLFSYKLTFGTVNPIKNMSN
jgi:hypothetical protein